MNRWSPVGRYTVTLLIALAAMNTAPDLFAGDNIRVLLDGKANSVTVESPGGLQADSAGGSGRRRWIIRSATLPKSGRLRIEPKSGILRVNGRKYRGAIEVRRRSGGRLMVINDLDVEDYLRGVVPAEIPPDWEDEVLKAQAVASRTYALYQRQETARRPYAVLATVDSQMYLGMSAERESSTKAVNATAGLIVVSGGRPIPAFYHSSCGGHTENAALLWGLDETYLRGVDCDCQEISRYGLWEKRIGRSAVSVALRRCGFRLSGIKDVRLGEVTPSGHVRTIVFSDKSGPISVPAETLRMALGYSRIPSTFFEPELWGEDIVFSGRGMGHGVGLCQWGARTLARKGFDFRRILAYYYPGTSIARAIDFE